MEVIRGSLRQAIEGCEKAEQNSLITANNLLTFFANIFEDIRMRFVEIEKIETRNEDFFDLEGETSVASDSNAKSDDSAKSDSDYLSKVSETLSYLFPSVWKRQKAKEDKEDDKEAKSEKHKIEAIEQGTKIFPQGKPMPGEVQQKGIGGCYLMAALIALAKKKPKVIEDCFVQGIKDINKEDVITIRFYGYNKSCNWGK